MSAVSPATLREKSSWTPKNYPPSNEKIFHERMALIRKWFTAWDENQRWVLIEYVLKHMNDAQLTTIYELLHPLVPPPDHDFTRTLPKHLCIKIFSYLDPQSLCRASQVCWYWRYLSEANDIWKLKCLRRGWFLPTPPNPFDTSAWKRHYVACVSNLYWSPPQPQDVKRPEDTSESGDVHEVTVKSPIPKRRVLQHSVAEHPQKPWRGPDKFPKDIQKTTVLSTSLSSNAWLPQFKPKTRKPSSVRTSTLPQGEQRSLQQSGEMLQASRYVPSSPSVLIHPTLLEKLRIGTPTEGHQQLCTLNNPQSESSIVDQLYTLQTTSPFPKLPSYYIHSERNRGKVDTRASTNVQPTQQKNSQTKPKDEFKGTVADTYSSQSPSELQTQPWNIAEYMSGSEDST